MRYIVRVNSQLLLQPPELLSTEVKMLGDKLGRAQATRAASPLPRIELPVQTLFNHLRKCWMAQGQTFFHVIIQFHDTIYSMILKTHVSKFGRVWSWTSSLHTRLLQFFQDALDGSFSAVCTPISTIIWDCILNFNWTWRALYVDWVQQISNPISRTILKTCCPIWRILTTSKQKRWSVFDVSTSVQRSLTEISRISVQLRDRPRFSHSSWTRSSSSSSRASTSRTSSW